jgi:hypothetical protein
MSTAEEVTEGREYWQRVEIVRSAAWALEDMLREKLRESDITDIDCGECLGECIRCEVGRKILELSDAVAEGFSEYCEQLCEEENLDEEKCSEVCEEEFNRVYEEELEEINEEFMINTRARIDSELFRITIEPLPCEGDYSIVGSEVTVEFKENIEHFKDENCRNYWLGKIAEVISTILREL